MLVEDEPDLLRPPARGRSRVEKEFLPDGFAERTPAKRPGEIANDIRIRRRVPAQKGFLPMWTRSRWGRIAVIAIGVVAAAGGITAALAVRHFFDTDPRFQVNSSDLIQTTGNSQLTRHQLLSIFGSDIGRNIFFIPLAERRAELERIPWVEHATVMRILPNQLRVKVKERTPVAFVRVGDQIELVDGSGVFLSMPPAMMAARHFSFPVVTGIRGSDPLSVRAARMGLYQKFVAALDSTGEHLSANLSEVDLSDPEDVRVMLPAKSSDLLLHFGDTNFLARYRIYQQHLKEWEQQYPQLASVDLRYENEVVLKMSSDAAAASDKLKETPSPMLSAAPKVKANAGAKPRRPAAASAAASGTARKAAAGTARKAAAAKHERRRKEHPRRAKR